MSLNGNCKEVNFLLRNFRHSFYIECFQNCLQGTLVYMSSGDFSIHIDYRHLEYGNSSLIQYESCSGLLSVNDNNKRSLAVNYINDVHNGWNPMRKTQRKQNTAFGAMKRMQL